MIAKVKTPCPGSQISTSLIPLDDLCSKSLFLLSQRLNSAVRYKMTTQLHAISQNLTSIENLMVFLRVLCHKRIQCTRTCSSEGLGQAMLFLCCAVSNGVENTCCISFKALTDTPMVTNTAYALFVQLVRVIRSGKGAEQTAETSCKTVTHYLCCMLKHIIKHISRYFGFKENLKAGLVHQACYQHFCLG